MITTDEAISLLETACRATCDPIYWAMANGIDHDTVLQILKGRRKMTPQVMAALGYRKRVMWEKINN